MERGAWTTVGWLVAAGALAAAFLLTGPSTDAQASRSPAAERAERLGGRIASRVLEDPRGGVDWGEAEGVVDAPYALVRAVVRDYPAYKDFLPHFRKSRLLSRRGDRAMLYLEARILKGAVTLWAQMLLRERQEDGGLRIDARKVRGNMARFEARWEVRPLDGGRRALVRFRILVDPDLPLPDSVVSEENRKSARRAIQGLRREVARRLERALRTGSSR